MDYAVAAIRTPFVWPLYPCTTSFELRDQLLRTEREHDSGDVHAQDGERVLSLSLTLASNAFWVAMHRTYPRVEAGQRAHLESRSQLLSSDADHDEH